MRLTRDEEGIVTKYGCAYRLGEIEGRYAYQRGAPCPETLKEPASRPKWWQWWKGDDWARVVHSRGANWGWLSAQIHDPSRPVPDLTVEGLS